MVKDVEEKEAKGDFITDPKRKHKNPFNFYLLCGVYYLGPTSSVRNKAKRR